ncbi:MAG: sialidase-1 [Planctomycetota bacterium]|jgi:sialidase-1
MINAIAALCLVLAVDTPVEVFKGGDDGYKTYRIPAMVQAANGDLLAFCEGRRVGSSDSGDIDILLKRSSDGGLTWSDSAVVWDDGANTCGNPCPVLDRRTGKILLLLTHNSGRDHEHAIIAGTSEGTRTVWVCESEDDGKTWTAPREVTSTTKQANWTWYATGPGAGIQLERGEHAGRLVIPCDHIEAETKHYYSHVIISDDGGASWKLGGSTPEHQVNECEVAELEDGRLLLNMRNYDSSKHQRQIAFSKDSGMTWTGQTHDAALIEPRCQASLRRLRWAQGDTPGVVLFSNPAHEKSRARMTLRASFDDGKSWPLEQLLYEGSSAYSCLVALKGGDAGCFFEVDGYKRILFLRIPQERFSR